MAGPASEGEKGNAKINISTIEIAKAYKNANDTDLARPILYGLIIQSLAPREQQVYRCLENGATMATEIARGLDLKINHVGNLLLKLVSYGLVKRNPIAGDNGLCYIYELIINGNDYRHY